MRGGAARLGAWAALIFAWGCGDANRSGDASPDAPLDAAVEAAAGSDVSSAYDGRGVDLDVVSPPDTPADQEIDGGSIEIPCIDICSLKAAVGCGGDGGCAQGCQTDPGRLRCPAESDAVFACVLADGATALTCENGVAKVKADHCRKEQEAAMACLLGTAR